MAGMPNGDGYAFREKVPDPAQRATIFEYIPPEIGTGEEDLRRSAATLVKTVSGFDVDGLYFPHVVDESRGETGRVWRPDRVAPRDFARYVREHNRSLGTEHDRRMALLVSETFAYRPRAEFDQWVAETAQERHIGNIVVVGKSYADDAVAGYEVVEALLRLERLREEGVNVFPGAIAIDKRPGEAIRMAQKTAAGARYFTTQLFYDAGPMIALLRGYKDECERREVAPARVFLSTAPIPTTQNLALIETFLRRPVEEHVKRRLFDEADGKWKRRSGSGNESVRQIEDVYRRVFDAVYGEKLGPVGLCVEHVTDSNFRHAMELLHELPELWRREYHPGPAGSA